MKITLDTDDLTIAQLYALSWMVIDQPEMYKAVVDEHNRRERHREPRRREGQ